MRKSLEANNFVGSFDDCQAVRGNYNRLARRNFFYQRENFLLRRFVQARRRFVE